MSRFVAPDLAALPPLSLTPVDYTVVEARRLEYLIEALTIAEVDYDVGVLQTDPMRIALSQGGAAIEMALDQRINEAVRRTMLATADGEFLDHIGATFYGVSRQTFVEFDGQTQVIVEEGDDRFRSRIALAPEAFSTAGPRGAYIFHALELDGERDIADAAAYGEEDGATYSTTVVSAGMPGSVVAAPTDGQAVDAPEVLVVVVPTEQYGDADQALIDRVLAAVSADEVRPIGDLVRVEAAEMVGYSVRAVLRVAPGAAVEPIVALARSKTEEYVAARRRIGFSAQRTGIGGALQVDVSTTVELIWPVADVGGGPKQVPWCSNIIIDVEVATGVWS